MAEMKFKFTIQPYQTEAVDSVVGVFAGQPFNDHFTYRRDVEIRRDVTNWMLSDEELYMGFANAKVQLDYGQLLENIRRIQTRNNIKLSDSLKSGGLGVCSLDVEMETGTGKTYVYIKTMFELNKLYGWSKFIVVVPSIAIREGVQKSFETMQEHFMEYYGKKARFFVYNSKNLPDIDNYSQSADINVMIINIQAFNARGKDARRIRTELDEGGDQELLQKRDDLQARLKEIEAEKEQVTAEIEEVKLNKDVVVEKIENLRAAIAKLQLQKTELKSRLTYDQTDAERLQQELASTEREIKALQYAIEQGEDRHEQIDVSVLEKQLQATLQEKTALEQAVIRKQFELEDLEGQSEDVAGHMEQARRQNEEWIRLQAKAESNRDRLADKLNKLMLALTDEFKMSFEEASKQANELENLAQSEQVLKDLEKAIKALGPVNIDAIEQYDEVKTRFDFLSAQREDVLAAKNILLETINVMNFEVKERFKSKFEAILESFRVTFKQMFGGGSADLILTDGDLLSAGVEISVQPPGKKIQSLNLMSGGEKALSALALLFSIIRVKTIPFVILDEVEAALDEANVKRFGDYLNRFDKESQFIVVTHRKGTMAAADSIYGVTMQESGVSKIVSVKLKDIEGMDNGN